MNQFKEYVKEKENAKNQRIKIKSKYFGEYQPQLYIASRSKSKQNSQPKHQIKKIDLKPHHQNPKTQSLTTLTLTNNSNNTSSASVFTKNQQLTSASIKNINLTDFLLKRQSQLKNKKDESAIEKIIRWVQNRYYGKHTKQTMNGEIDVQFSNKQNQRFEQKIKRISYDLYVIRQLKNKNTRKYTFNQFINHEGKNLAQQMNKQQMPSYQKYATSTDKNNSKQHDIDEIQGSNYKKYGKIENKKMPQKQFFRVNGSETIMNMLNSQRLQDSKQNKNMPSLFPISEMSVQNYIGSEVKIYESTNYQHQQYSKTQQYSPAYVIQAYKLKQIDQNSHLNTQILNQNKIQFQFPNDNSNDKQISFQPSSINLINSSGVNKSSLIKIQKQLERQVSNIKNSDQQNLIYSGYDKINEQIQGKYPMAQSNDPQIQNLEQQKSINFNFQSLSPSYEKSQLSKLMPIHDQKEPQIIMNSSAKSLVLSSIIIHDNRNSTQLCDLQFYPNSLFHPQITSSSSNKALQTDLLNIDRPLQDQILNQIFQMNNSQQQTINFLKANNKNNNIDKIMFSDRKVQAQNINYEKMELKKTIDTKIDSEILKYSKIQSHNSTRNNNFKKTAAENYFQQHLITTNKQVTQSNTFNTYEMPLSRANNQIITKNISKQVKINNKLLQKNQTNLPQTNQYVTQNLLSQRNHQVQLFTFNSLNSPSNQNNFKPRQLQNKLSKEGNAFVQNCNLFDCGERICPIKSNDLNRQNYFTQASKISRQRLTSQNSNQSKTLSKPKISFKYLSPSQKYQIKPLQSPSQQGNSSLFKSHSSHLKNTGKAPIKIQIKPKQNDRSDKFNQKNQNLNLIKNQNYRQNRNHDVKYNIDENTQINRQIRSKTIAQQRTRCYSVQKIQNFNKQDIPQNRFINIGPQHYQLNKIISHKNAFISQSFLPYQSQRLISTNIDTNKNLPTSSNYYFTHLIPSNQLNPTQNFSKTTQPNNASQTSVFHNLNKNQKKNNQAIKNQKSTQIQEINKNNRKANQNLLLYPLNESKQKNRNKRARSLNQKIFVTVKNKK